MENSPRQQRCLCGGSLQEYPIAPPGARAATLSQCQRMLLSAGLRRLPRLNSISNPWPTTTSPNARSKILFALANYVSEQDQARALNIMTEAYQTKSSTRPRTWILMGALSRE